MRVAQCYRAHCAAQSGYSKTGSGTCALRREVWRGAPLNQEATKFGSGSCVLRRVRWRGAPLKIQKGGT
ncbi:hypothetical protein A2U01_0036371 [Trifolium medium]|uniref:Uncharacterized protein n=1 Tax=Trifolium medium TaxID=97028 RepID=A0A392PWC9_9FABA|nr:hypothetical protein [Trifolium medium]